MNKYFTLLILLTCTLVSLTQTDPVPKTTNETSVIKGTLLLDASYGGPFLFKSALRSSYQNQGELSFLRSTNHLVLRIGMMVSNRMEIGFESTYAQAKIHYVTPEKTEERAEVSKQRFLVRFAWHFATSRKWDPYVTLGAGYAIINYDQTERTPNNFSSNQMVDDFVPVALRMGTGVRFFLFKNFGLNAEVGIGGPLIQGGLTLKI